MSRTEAPLSIPREESAVYALDARGMPRVARVGHARADLIGCGVYAIVHQPSGRTYVGSAVSVGWRWAGHKRALRDGKHHSQYLQRAWNKYGEQAFRFVLLETCNESELLLREQYWMDTLQVHDSAKGFNTLLVAGSRLGCSPSRESVEKMRLSKTNPSDETRRRLSESHLRNTHSLETRKKISSNHRKRVLSDEAIKAIRLEYGPPRGPGNHHQHPTYQELGEKYGVGLRQIWLVVTNRVWKDV